MNEAYKRQVKLLLDVLPEIAKEDCFAMHGGTAINLFLQDMPRLSVDIDLTYVGLEVRAEALADSALADFMNNYDGDYNPITNNCTAPIQQGLQQVGVNIGNSILPVSVGNAILNSGAVNGFTFQTPSQPATGSSAPWAK